MTEYLGGLHLERSKGTRDQTPLHTIRTEANRVGHPIDKNLLSTINKNAY